MTRSMRIELRTVSLKRIAAVVALALSSAAVSAQDVPPTQAFAEDPDAIRTGMGVYRLRCADCHGTDARGVRGPDLTQLWAA
jgi:mono/diheme cytochrome c family protein